MSKMHKQDLAFIKGYKAVIDSSMGTSYGTVNDQRKKLLKVARRYNGVIPSVRYRNAKRSVYVEIVAFHELYTTIEKWIQRQIIEDHHMSSGQFK